MTERFIKKSLFKHAPLVCPIGISTQKLQTHDLSENLLAWLQAHQKTINYFDTGLGYGGGYSPFLLKRLPWTSDDWLSLKIELGPLPSMTDSSWEQLYQLWKRQISFYQTWLPLEHVHVIWILNEPEEWLWMASSSGEYPGSISRLFESLFYKVFDFFEEQCRQYSHQYFGFSSQVLGQPPSHPLHFFHLSLFQDWSACFPHWKVIQAPLNWLESPFMHSDFASFLQNADIGLVGVRPFHAITKDGSLLQTIRESYEFFDDPAFKVWCRFLDELHRTLQDSYQLKASLRTLTLYTLSKMPGVSVILTDIQSRTQLREVMDVSRIIQFLNQKQVYETIQNHLFELGF